NPNTCLGFSTNPLDPSTQFGDRIGNGPFFADFKSERLVVLPTPPVSTPALASNPSVTNTSYFSYQDPFAKDPTDWNVYAYFSSYGKMNGYNRYYNYYGNNSNIGVPMNDCNSLTVEDYSTGNITPNGTYNGGPWPYAQKVG